MTSDRVGSLPEEAAKLLAVLQGWATEAGFGPPSGMPTDRANEARESDRASDPAADDNGSGGDGRSSASESSEHTEHQQTAHDAASPGHAAHDPLATECQWCPLCRLVRVGKATSPEVREHLTNAATSFALAIEGLLETPAERRDRPDRDAPIEKIDLAED